MKKIIYSMALVAGLSAISVGCSSDEQMLTQEMQASTPVEGGKIKFSLPKAFSSVQTYAFAGTNEENYVDLSKMHALVFDGTDKLVGIFNQSNGKLTQVSNDYFIDVQQSGTFKLLILANLDTTTLDAQITPGETYVTIMNKITSQELNGTQGSFVMKSELLNNIVVDVTNGAEITEAVKLERLAARFDFSNEVADLVITEIKFKNRFKKSKLAAPSNNLDDSSKEEKSYGTTEFGTKPQTALYSIVYGYENVDLNQTEFEFSGTYKGKAITPFTIKLSKMVKRNHRYLINISEEGSLSPTPPVTPPGTTPKMKFNIQVLDWAEGTKFVLEDSKLSNALKPKLVAGTTAKVTYNFATDPKTMVAAHDVTSVTFVTQSQSEVNVVPVGAVTGYTVAKAPNGTTYNADGEIVQQWIISFVANATTDNIVRQWDVVNSLDPTKKETVKLIHKHQNAMSPRFQNAPFMKLVPYAVNKDGNGFVNNYDINNPNVGYFNFTQAKAISIPGYTLPTKDEWQTILPGSSSYARFDLDNSYNDESDTNSLGSFTADYRNKLSEKTTYAVKFKEDAELKSAWRYRYVDNKALIIDIIPLNNDLVNKTIDDVEQSNFWINNSDNIVKTITLPLFGYIWNNILTSKGQYGGWWAATEFDSDRSYIARVDSNYADADTTGYIQAFFSVFLLQN